MRARVAVAAVYHLLFPATTLLLSLFSERFKEISTITAQRHRPLKRIDSTNEGEVYFYIAHRVVDNQRGVELLLQFPDSPVP